MVVPPSARAPRHDGEWDAADDLDDDGTGDINQLLAFTVLTERAIRRGDDDAEQRLAALTAAVDQTGEVQRITPALELAVEWARQLQHEGEIPRRRLHTALCRPLYRAKETDQSAG